jgi:acetyl-CoA acyltransferase
VSTDTELPNYSDWKPINTRFKMKDCYIVHAKRTPIGRIGGKLSHVRPDDMMSELIKDYASSVNYDLKEIDDVIVGCANQAGEDNRNIARMAAVLGGLPYEQTLCKFT